MSTLICICNSKTSSRLKIMNVILLSFNITNRLRPGDAMSLILFDLVLEFVVRKIPRMKLITFSDKNMLLAYADDIVIIQKTQKGMKKSMI